MTTPTHLEGPTSGRPLGRTLNLAGSLDPPLRKITVELVEFSYDTTGFDGRRHTDLRLTIADSADIATLDLGRVVFLHRATDDEPLSSLRAP